MLLGQVRFCRRFPSSLAPSPQKTTKGHHFKVIFSHKACSEFLQIKSINVTECHRSLQISFLNSLGIFFSTFPYWPVGRKMSHFIPQSMWPSGFEYFSIICDAAGRGRGSCKNKSGFLLQKTWSFLLMKSGWQCSKYLSPLGDLQVWED